jgi:hypothetical protein
VLGTDYNVRYRSVIHGMDEPCAGWNWCSTIRILQTKCGKKMDREEDAHVVVFFSLLWTFNYRTI